MNNKEKYNGWENRSTWLAILWLDNESREVNDRAREIAIVCNTTKRFKSQIKPILLEIKGLWKEQDFDALKINFSEVWEHLAPSTKY